MKFDDNTKQVNEFNSNYLDYGVHEVKIGMLELGQTDNGKEYLEFTLIGPNEEEETARVWFTTEKAANYSFNTCRQIYIHNAPENAKDTARDKFDAVQDTEGMVKLMQKLVGGTCWLSKYPDPERTYINQAGETKHSINKNVYGYRPKERPELLPKKDNVVPLDGEDITGTDAAKGIPDDWS